MLGNLLKTTLFVILFALFNFRSTKKVLTPYLSEHERFIASFSSKRKVPLTSKKLLFSTVPNDRCSYAVIEELLKMNYTFGTSDPPEFRGDQLRFFKGTEGVLMMAGVRLEAVLVEREGRQGLQLYKVSAG